MIQQLHRRQQSKCGSCMKIVLESEFENEPILTDYIQGQNFMASRSAIYYLRQLDDLFILFIH